MKFKNNEQGYTLLMVLLLIAVFTILGLALFSMNISATKQFDQKEEQVQARHLAEMGLLHYKAEIKEIVEGYTFQKDENENNNDVLERSGQELCQRLLAINVEKEVFTDIKGEYDVTKESCETEQDEKLELKLTSVGKVNETVKTISATATLTPPTVMEEDNGIPSRPEFPGIDNPKKELPDGADDDVVVDGPVETKKETQYFWGSLVVNRATSEPTFKIGGGKAYNVTVEKDFYIDGDIDSQNHACIVVKGNLTINGKSKLGNKTVFIVYGNAYFGQKPIFGNHHAQIYVAGNAYIGSTKTMEYKSPPTSTDCPIPNDIKDPYNPVPQQYQWNLDEKLNPIYG